MQDMDTAQDIWGKNIQSLKRKTTRTKPIDVAHNFMKIPKEIPKLHKEIFLMAYISFVDKIAFMLTLS
eukprot:9995506-Ditylum_brightwellii.AAC.2